MKTALITGAVTGIGEGLACKLLDEGWQVFAGYRSASPEQARWYGKPNAIPVQCDVTQEAQVFATVEKIRQQTGGTLDLLINNAGYAGNSGVIEAAQMDDYRRTFEVNFWGPLQVAQACIPLLKKARGRIINTTSASVYLTIPMGSSYPVAKTALKSLSLHLRMEMAPFGVQVTSLEPGGVETPMTALGEDVSEAQWNSIPESLRSEYQKHFIDGATAVGGSFKLYAPEIFADKVYRQIITAKKLAPSYLIGPGSAPLPWLHRLLPAQVVQNIWGKMFAAKHR
ncbi:Short-chain dehydrogenase/reductase SDR [gamma proteobacterium HdN1]|nr:Short-chain dehydrogenase/reductase SDR [gamma proteobacterium HdN1]